MTRFVFAITLMFGAAMLSVNPPTAVANGAAGCTARSYCDYYRLKIRSAGRQQATSVRCARLIQGHRTIGARSTVNA